MKTIVGLIAPLDALKVRLRLLVKLVLILLKSSRCLVYNQLGVWWPKVINSSVTMLGL